SILLLLLCFPLTCTLFPYTTLSDLLLFKDDANNPVNVVCFWSSKQAASKCCIDDWQNYKPQEICIATFIEDYLVNVYNESFIAGDRKSTRLNSSHVKISYAVFCLKN